MSKDHRLPSEKELIEILESLKPIPGAGLYQKLEGAPWIRHTRQTRRRSISGQRLMAAASLILILSAVVAIIFPSLSAIAHSTANGFLQFTRRADSDQKVVTYTARVLPDGYSEAEMDLPFYFSVEQASLIAGFEVRVPPLMPNDYRLDGADARKDFVSLRYIATDSLSSSTIELQQWIVGSSTSYEVEEIGESALVETFRIGALEGEYVEGHWQLIGTSLDHNQQPGTTITKVFHWQNRGGATLIWRDGNVMYTLAANPGIRRDDMLAIARCTYYPFKVMEPSSNLAGHRRHFSAKYIGCDLETNTVNQTFASTNQLLIFRQRPVLQSIGSDVPLTVESEETIRFQTANGYFATARAIAGQWIDNLPETPRITDIDKSTRGIRWTDGDHIFELWAIGAGHENVLGINDIMEIARTIH